MGSVSAQVLDEAALLVASERLQRDFLAHQEGFMRRELVDGAIARVAVRAIHQRKGYRPAARFLALAI